MRHYELVCIVHPDLDEAAFNGVVEKVKGWVVETSGSVDKVEVWGRKRLAYPSRNIVKVNTCCSISVSNPLLPRPWTRICVSWNQSYDI